jgi:hypothetical protein
MMTMMMMMMTMMMMVCQVEYVMETKGGLVYCPKVIITFFIGKPAWKQ